MNKEELKQRTTPFEFRGMSLVDHLPDSGKGQVIDDRALRSETSVLNLPIVLILNRHWQAIHVKTPAEAFCMLASAAALALHITEDGGFLPTKWDEWIGLPIRDCDMQIRSTRGVIRVPTVVIAVKYGRMHLRRPSLGARGIWERDGGVCQYTGRKLKPEEGNIDHVVPRSRGGQTSWENCVLSHREVNSRKADRMPREAGLRLLRVPVAPRVLPASAYIRNQYGIRDWDHFLK